MTENARRSGRQTLPASTLAEIAGIKRQLLGQWAGRGLLRASKRAGCDELDAIELVTLKTLMATLGPEDSKIAWAQVRPRVRERLPLGRIDVVYDSQEKLAILAYNDEQIVRAVRTARPVRVIPLEEPIGRVRDSFQRVLAAQSPTSRPQRLVRLKAADHHGKYEP